MADIDRPNIRVEILNSDEEAVNLGTLLARNISIYGGLVRNSGLIQASSAVVGEGGKVVLKAAQRVVLEPTSVIEATGEGGAAGGEVNVSAGTPGAEGNVTVQGVVSVAALPQAFIRPNMPSAYWYLV